MATVRAHRATAVRAAVIAISTATLVGGLAALPASAYTSTQVAKYGNSTALSANGRWLAFSTTSRLVAADTNNHRDVYLRDLSLGTLRLVSDPVGAAVANGDSDPVDVDPSKQFAALDVSVDGSYVVFTSKASNLVLNDNNGKFDVFRWTRSTGAIALVSRASGAAVSGNGNSSYPQISGDGRYVVFQSYATNLTGALPAGRLPGTNDLQVLVRDMATGQTTFQSMRAGGTFPSGSSSQPDISADGRFIAFRSNASDLVAGDWNGRADVFRRSLSTGSIALVSRTTTGAPGTDGSFRPSISGTGRYVAFESDAALDPGHDSNGDRDVYVRDLTAHTTQLVSYVGGADASLIGYPSIKAGISADGRRVSYCSCDQAFDFPVTVVATWASLDRTVVSANTVSPSISGNGRRVADIGWQTAQFTQPTRWTDLGSASSAGAPTIVFSGATATITDAVSGIAQVTIDGAPRRISGAGTTPVLSGQVVRAWNGAGVLTTRTVP